MKRILISAFCLAGAILLAASCGNSNKKAEKQAAEQARLDSLEQAEMLQKQKEAMATLATLPEEPVFDIVTNMGTMRIKLYSQTPKHRENFAKLALSGYYNGGPGYTVPAEFVPEYTHKKGALAAARRGDAANPMKESSGSQFYIVQSEAACAQLDGDYTVFGETISGLDVIDKIAAVQTDQRDRPLNDVKIVSINLVKE